MGNLNERQFGSRGLAPGQPARMPGAKTWHVMTTSSSGHMETSNPPMSRSNKMLSDSEARRRTPVKSSYKGPYERKDGYK